MTMQAEQLIGSRVTGKDGQVVGTVQQIFNDDKDGTPVWARIRSGTRELFVPLGGSRVTKDGLNVPYDTKQIMSSPDITVERHMSAGQTDQLKRHFGLTVPAQGGPPDAGNDRGQAPQDAAQRGQGQAGQDAQDETDRGQDQGGGQAEGDQALRDEAQAGQTQAGQAQAGQAQAGQTQAGQTQTGQAQAGQTQAGETQTGQAQAGQAQGDQLASGGTGRGETQRGEAQRDEAQDGQDWLILAEERVDVDTEMRESGRARLHKYVDVEPVEQTVHVYHEEYEIERVPIPAEEQVRGEIAEQEVEITLHEERPVLHKEAVAVERVRLKVKRVAEDRTLRDEIRRERLEVEDGGQRTPQPAGSGRPQGRS
jgi:uncharacterized protein (TIGR02271 family)